MWKRLRVAIKAAIRTGLIIYLGKDPAKMMIVKTFIEQMSDERKD